MEREREWKVTAEEEENDAEDSGGGLEIRQRNKGKMGKYENEEKQPNGDQEYSVYFQSDKGVWKCRHCTWTYYLSSPGIEFIQKHDNSCQVVKGVETLVQLGTRIGFQNEGSESKSRNGSTINGDEIQENEQHTARELSKFIVEEYDVERVLAEQETHDLYCPHCRSCITKRVILCKRKRTPQGDQSDLPPQKLPHLPVAADDHEGETVFRCLSCFSFFIPTETGFNIFPCLPCFGDGAASNGLQSQGKKPAECGNWISSLFGSGSSDSEGTESGEPAAIAEPPSHKGPQINSNTGSSRPPATSYFPPGYNVKIPASTVKPISGGGITESNENIHGPQTPAAVHTSIDMGIQGEEDSNIDNRLDVLKSIVYGGLIESVTSLSVVSSAAGSGSSTLNVCALGLANLIGGLFVITHEIAELRGTDSESTNQRVERSSPYWEKLGKKQHFWWHFVLAVLSYIIFGLLPPVIYAFSFRESDDREHKMMAVAASSLLCIALLAIGKAHVRPQRDYIRTLFFYFATAVPASGLSFVAGVMIDRLLAELGLFKPSTSPPSSVDLLKFGSGSSSWASL